MMILMNSQMDFYNKLIIKTNKDSTLVKKYLQIIQKKQQNNKIKKGWTN